MKELLCFSHAATEFSASNMLSDFNLVLFEREITLLVGPYNSGKSCLKKILHGTQAMTAGTVSLQGQPQHLFSGDILRENGVYYIDQTTQLVQQLTVAENLFLLRSGQKKRFLYRSQAAKVETAHILKQYGLTCSPQDRIYQLSVFQQYLLALVKAFSNRASLIILDFTFVSFHEEELRRLMTLLTQERERGTSFLIIQDIPDALTEIADQVVLVDKGRDIKLFFRDDTDLHEILYYLSTLPGALPSFLSANCPEEPPVSLTVQKDGREVFHCARGDLIGFYDYFYSANSSPEHYLSSFLGQNNLHTLYDHKLLDDFLTHSIFIPAGCDQYLHDNLSIGENLLLPHYEKIHSSLGRIKGSLLEYCTQAFYREFQLSEPYPGFADLSMLERRLLAIFRWKMFKPQILFLEGPSIGLDLAGEQIVFEYLKKCSQEGSIIFIMSNRRELLQKYCSQVVMTQNAQLL